MLPNKLEPEFLPDRFRDHGSEIPQGLVRQKVDCIIIPKKHYEKAIRTLENSDLETLVIFFGRVKGNKLLVTDVYIPSNEDYTSRTSFNIKIPPDALLKEFLKQYSSGNTEVADMHSHPSLFLSNKDVKSHLDLMKIFPHHVSGIFCKGAVKFFKLERDGVFSEVRYKIIDLERFDRQIRIFGETSQLLLSSTCIALVGVGGGNTKIAFDLAAMGIGKIILVDPDVWEETNRNRVLIPREHVGVPKVRSVKEIIEKHYQDVEVEAFPARIQEVPEVLNEADLIVVGPDNFITREFCNRQALKLRKTAVFVGAGINVKNGRVEDMGGSVQVVIPGKTPCYECVHRAKTEEILKETLSDREKKRISEKYGVNLEADVTPSIVCLNDVLSGLAIHEIVKIITGFDEITPFKVYNALEDKVFKVKVNKDPNCPACSFKAMSRIEEINGVKEESDILNSKKA